MKNLLIPIFTSVLLFGLVSTGTTQNSTTKPADQPAKGRNFVDLNNDGICDNQPAGKQNVQGRNFVDANNDGICDNRGKQGQNVNGANFVDKNNDGICDRRGNKNGGKGNCYRNGGKGNGKGKGCGNYCRRGNGNR